MPDPYNLPRNPKFKDMYNIVHIDEKWFDLTRKKRDLLCNERCKGASLAIAHV